MAKRTFSQVAASNEPTTRQCPTLAAAIPNLKSQLAKYANEDNAFPLFTPKLHEQFWKSFDLNAERQAAIFVPLVSVEGVPSLLFTTRASHLPTHASQVSFPGGHFDATVDATLEDTALREAQEELLGNYPWQDVQILGRATALPSLHGTPVTPIIGVLPYEITPDTFPGHAGEVEEVFCVSISDLIDIETSQPNLRFHGRAPVFPAGENRRIWGLTAIVTRPLLHKIFKPVFVGKNNKEKSTMSRL